MRSIEAFYQANMECIKKSNIRYKSVIKFLGKKKAESIVQVNGISECYNNNGSSNN